MSSPYAGLLAGAGAAQGFEQLLARRLEAEKFQEIQRQARAHEELQNRTLQETAKNREEQTAMRYWMQDQAHQDRQAVLEEKNRAATEGEKMKRISLALGQPIGSQVGVSEAQGQMKAGVPSSMYEYHPGTFGSEGLVPAGVGKPPVMNTTPGQPEGYTFQGGEANRLKREHEAGINSRDEENRLLKVSLEQMREASASAKGPIRPMQITAPDGSNMTVLVNGQGQVVYAAPSQLPAGMKSSQASANSLVDQLDSITQQGEKIGWQGVGALTGPVQGFRKRVTGGGSDPADMLRTAIDSAKADVAHEKYGSAFTATERQMLSQFAPSSNMSAPAIKNRIATMKRVIGQRLQEISAGTKPSALALGSVAGTGTTPPKITSITEIK